MLNDFFNIIFVFFFAGGFFGASWLLSKIKRQPTRREPSKQKVIVQLQRLHDEIHLYDSLRQEQRDEGDKEYLCLGLYTKVMAFHALKDVWNWCVS
jgi:hypothetical protein